MWGIATPEKQALAGAAAWPPSTSSNRVQLHADSFPPARLRNPCPAPAAPRCLPHSACPPLPAPRRRHARHPQGHGQGAVPARPRPRIRGHCGHRGAGAWRVGLCVGRIGRLVPPGWRAGGCMPCVPAGTGELLPWLAVHVTTSKRPNLAPPLLPHFRTPAQVGQCRWSYTCSVCQQTGDLLCCEVSARQLCSAGNSCTAAAVLCGAATGAAVRLPTSCTELARLGRPPQAFCPPQLPIASLTRHPAATPPLPAPSTPTSAA